MARSDDDRLEAYAYFRRQEALENTRERDDDVIEDDDADGDPYADFRCQEALENTRGD